MKHFLSLFLLQLCMVCPLFAQDNPTGGDDNPYKELYKLKMLLDDQDKALTKKDAEILRLQGEIAELKDKNRIKALEQHVKSLTNDSISLSRQLQDALQAQASSQQQQADAWQQQHDKDLATIARLQNELEQLNEFRGQYLAQLASSVEDKWLNKLYSEIDMDELEADYALYDKFASIDKDVAAARNKLQPLLQNARLYQEGVQAVKSPYDKLRIGSLIPRISDLRKVTSNPNQKQELKNLFIQLDTYEYSLKTFQSLITDIETVISGLKTHAGALSLVEAKLKDTSIQADIAEIIKIPWLEDMYKAYLEEMQENSMLQGNARNTIMGMKLN